jgi:RimJ/RimL family protein N-acetyltransferase
MFKIVDTATGSGVGLIGWMVVPEFQGRGIAAATTAQA